VTGFYGPASGRNPSYLSARRFGVEHLWMLPETDGVLSCEMHRTGKTVIGCEYLGAGQLSPQGSLAYTRGVWSCLALWGIAPPHTLLPEGGDPFENDWQLAEADGLFHEHRSLGDHVRAGDLIAVTTDLRGRTVQEFRAASSGVVLALRSKAWLRKGDWGVLSGVPCRKEESHE
jgi:predicted deacylase